MVQSNLANHEVNHSPIDGVESSKTGATNLIKKLFGVPNERGGTTWLEEIPDYIKTTSYDPDHALVVRYKEARSGLAKRALNLYSVTIQSPYLKQLIRQILRNYPGETIDEEELVFEQPFHPFFHQWAILLATFEKSKQEESGRPDQIEALINVLKDEIGDGMRDAQSLAKNGNMTFRLLWTLFPPGCPVFSPWRNKDHCFLVNDAKYLTGEIEPTLALELMLLDHGGDRYGWRKTTIVVQAYAGSKRISTLPAVPLQFHENSQSVLEMLSARGAIAVDLMRGSPAYKAYEGSIRLHRSFDMEEQEVFVDGRTIIDAKGHSQLASAYSPTVYTIPHRLECLLSRDPHTKLVNTAGNDRQNQGLLQVLETLNLHPVLSVGQTKLRTVPLTGTDTSPLKQFRWTEALFGIRPEVFCRSVVRGYCLSSKSWADFEVDNIADIQWNKNAFGALVMSLPRKRLLEALVKQQQNHKADADVDDIIQGKGQGLIMLLTGPPGTGKTLTAESIADRLQLPLYAVSASELGDNAREIETYFGQILRLAATWNAVLLLDEADAFLEKRVDSAEARDRNKRVAGKFLATIHVLHFENADDYCDSISSDFGVLQGYIDPHDQPICQFRRRLLFTHTPYSPIQAARSEISRKHLEEFPTWCRDWPIGPDALCFRKSKRTSN